MKVNSNHLASYEEAIFLSSNYTIYYPLVSQREHAMEFLFLHACNACMQVTAKGERKNEVIYSEQTLITIIYNLIPFQDQLRRRRITATSKSSAAAAADAYACFGS